MVGADNGVGLAGRGDNETAQDGPEAIPARVHILHGFASRDDDLTREEAKQDYRGRLRAEDEPGEHLALVCAVQGHLAIHPLEVQVPVGDWDLDVRHHVLYVTGAQAERVAGNALVQKPGDEEGGVHALVPRPAAGDDELARGEEQRCAVGFVQAYGYGGELALVVEREREHLMYLVQVQCG